MRFWIVLLYCITILGLTKSQDNLNQVKVPITIFDHHPSLNPDFEKPVYGTLTPGLVNSILGKDSLPVLADDYYPGKGLITSRDTFASWFVPVNGVNMGVPSTLTFQKSTSDGSKYFINNDAFFPIDGLGLDALKNNSGEYTYQRYYDAPSNGKYHNYHFCLHMQSNFYYRGSETFTFKGDDDVWLFINNRLVVDLGGIHQAANQTIDLRNLNLDPNGNTPVKFDFFYCERHTYASEIEIETEMEFMCLRKDYCGICGGSGSECCNAKIDCNDNNPCTIDSCPPVNTPGITQDNWKSFCVNTPITCSDPDKCQISQCQNGTCVNSPKQCQSKPCSTSYCDPQSGCGYKPIECPATDKCSTSQCDPNTNTCSNTPVKCDDGNPCTEDTCDPKAGCKYVPKTCDDNNPCTNDRCVVESGAAKCLNEAIPASQCNCNCDNTACENFVCNPSGTCTKTAKVFTDGNLCTNDQCQVVNGNATAVFTAITCTASTDPCFIATCDPAKGCVNVPKDCNDGNPCTVDTCSNGKCVNTLNQCNDGNPCTLDHCNETIGACQNDPMPCNNTDICMIGQCHPNNGSCTYIPRVCPDSPDKFCEVGYCDPLAGCILIPRKCVPNDPDCQRSVCNEEKNKCEDSNFSPTPYKCLSTAAKAGVIGGAAIAGIVIGGAVALALAAFGGKKGYDHWKTNQQNKMSTSNANPLYEQNPNNGENPLYKGSG